MNNNDELIKKMMESFFMIKKNMMKNNVGLIHADDIKPSEEVLLLKIGAFNHGEKIIVTDIVNVLGLAPSTVSLTLNSLEEHGYIKRILNKDNRREIYVVLTEKGNKMLEKVKEKSNKLMNNLIEYLGIEDANKLVELLGKTASFLESREDR